MKIVLATPLYPPETELLASYTKELSLRLAREHEVTILAYATNSESVPTAKLLTISKRQRLPVRLLKYTFALWNIAPGQDIIYAQNAVAAGLPALLVSILRNIPLVINFDEDEAWKSATQLCETDKYLEDFLASEDMSPRIKLVHALQGLVMRHATMVLVQSEALSQIVTTHYRVPRAKLSVNHHVARKSELLPFPSPVVPFQLACGGKLIKENGIEGIVRATAILKQKFPAVSLLISGYGSEESALKSLTKELGIEEQVQFLGRVSHAESWHVAKSSVAYIHNPNKGFTPDHLLLGFSVGTPVVASRIPANTEVVKDGESALLVGENDPRDLTNAIERIFTDNELRDKLTKGGSMLLRERFSWDSHIGALLRTFTAVMTK